MAFLMLDRALDCGWRMTGVRTGKDRRTSRTSSAVRCRLTTSFTSLAFFLNKGWAS